MTNGIVISDVPDQLGYVRVGAWQLENGMISVALIGIYPAKTTQLGGSPPEALARLILSEFQDSNPDV